MKKIRNQKEPTKVNSNPIKSELLIEVQISFYGEILRNYLVD
jgi:hypothetical protein